MYSSYIEYLVEEGFNKCGIIMDQWIVTIVMRTDVSISNLILTRLYLVAKGCAAAWFAGDVRELLGFRLLLRARQS